MISQLPPQEASFSNRTAYAYACLSKFSMNMHLIYQKHIRILLLFPPKLSRLRYFYIRHNVTLDINYICKSCAALFYEKVLLPAHFAVNKPPGLGRYSLYRIPIIPRCFYLLCLCCTNDPPWSNFLPFNKSKLRNRSLLLKSRERSDRQGGRLGGKHKEIITCH
jgi:hypothetical protein